MEYKKSRWIGALFVFLSGPSSAQEETASAPCPAIMTAGEAVVRAAPDRAFVTVTAEARAREPESAQQQSANTMTSAQANLKELGVRAEAIRTLRYDLQPEYDYVKGRQTLRGYVARNAIEVRIDDLSQVGAIIDAGVDAGATSVTAVRFALKDQDELEREALKEAVTDARARADTTASGAGVSIERIWSIEEHRLPHRRPVPVMSIRAEATQDATTPVWPGPIQLFATVRLTACIQ
jgi:uncharacterized protein YggE